MQKGLLLVLDFCKGHQIVEVFHQDTRPVMLELLDQVNNPSMEGTKDLMNTSWNYAMIKYEGIGVELSTYGIILEPISNTRVGHTNFILVVPWKPLVCSSMYIFYLVSQQLVNFYLIRFSLCENLNKGF